MAWGPAGRAPALSAGPALSGRADEHPLGLAALLVLGLLCTGIVVLNDRRHRPSRDPAPARPAAPTVLAGERRG